MYFHYDRSFFTHFVLQTFAAVVFMILVLFSLDHVQASHLVWAAGASTLASSSFIVFGTPHIESAKPYCIVVGYLITILSGSLIRILSGWSCDGFLLEICQNPVYQLPMNEVTAVISMCLAFGLMVFFRCAHPPAAGLAIVMVLDIQNYKPVVVIFIAAIILAAVRFIFNKLLIKLV